MIPVDEAKLHEFIDRMLGDLGGAFSIALGRIGAALGLYTALRDGGPATSNELGMRTGLAERYLREWLAQQAASGYLSYNPNSGRFALPPEQAPVLADESSPFHMTGAFDIAAALLDNQSRVREAFKSALVTQRVQITHRSWWSQTKRAELPRSISYGSISSPEEDTSQQKTRSASTPEQT